MCGDALSFVFACSMRTTLCCRVQPAVIAVGSIFLAACDLNIPLPPETRWFELFDVSWEDVTKVCESILSLYTRPLPSYEKLAVGGPAAAANKSGGAGKETASTPSHNPRGGDGDGEEASRTNNKSGSGDNLSPPSKCSCGETSCLSCGRQGPLPSEYLPNMSSSSSASSLPLKSESEFRALTILTLLISADTLARTGCTYTRMGDPG